MLGTEVLYSQFRSRPLVSVPQRKEAAEKQRAAGEKGRGSPRTPAVSVAAEHDRLPVRPSESGLSRLRSVRTPLRPRRAAQDTRAILTEQRDDWDRK